MALILALYLGFALVFASALPAAAESSQSAIKADVMFWEGDELVVKELSGHEMRLVVTPETKIEGVVAGRLKTGDKIVAQVTEDRRALSITLQVPDLGSGGAPPSVR